MVDLPYFVQEIARWTSAVLELLGIAAIILSGIVATVATVPQLFSDGEKLALGQTRLRLARGILLGLEFLVAADIIRTVTIKPSFSSVGVLAIIIGLRTFLSFSLEAEVNGRWPWTSSDDK